MTAAFISPNDFPSGLDLAIKMRERRITLLQELQDSRDSSLFIYWNLDELKREDFFTLADMLRRRNKFHGHPIDAYEAEEKLRLTVKHSSGEEWAKTKELRDEYNEFVGQPGLIPGAIVTSAIETANLRSWRYQSIAEESSQVYQAMEVSDPWVRLPYSRPAHRPQHVKSGEKTDG